MTDHQPPNWSHCGEGTTSTDPVGCRGIRVAGTGRCLAHLPPDGRAAHLAALEPGADVDYRGVTLGSGLLGEVLGAVQDDTGCARFGDARFDGAVFTARAWFDQAVFTGDAVFHRAEFQWGATFERVAFRGAATFEGARFANTARFMDAVFCAEAEFRGARFTDRTEFTGATFHGEARFQDACFTADAWFNRADFQHGAAFTRASFAGDAGFAGARCLGPFHLDEASLPEVQRLGPLTGVLDVHLDGSEFGAPVVAELAAQRVSLAGTRFAAPAVLHVRYAEVDLTGVAIESLLTVAGDADPEPRFGEVLLAFGRDSPRPRVTSLRRVDAACLVLADVDLTTCVFSGVHHLDQIRLEGHCGFARPPRRRFPFAWVDRQLLGEEHHWRALPVHRPYAREGWTRGPGRPHASATAGPATLAVLYRQLRKAFEDAKDEPGAADFYYGEMEMRRHHAGNPWGERVLLHLYWALSGYGLRASRALGWLAACAALFMTLLMGLGLPDSSPTQTATGPIRDDRVSLVIDGQEPELTLGHRQRYTPERAEKSLRLVLNSVVFRSSGQNLTTAGTYIEMACRFTGPVLLGLAALAVRGRVKRS
ncbi:hypothetical protein AQ490_18880 [Wenjunlia vitaminophila]|uniref:Pentapeptide repeat protein n=1 Tax=Wenjunlia vitaminophila TaxID=76728 RepID=A0A0T6LUN5_WENVI|nr:pentapeptide repeat-containing protein [Wenjunlia vitaminophila]KRV49765.1 hypothetical protein AQ490_18880 [Wenjunlia vitaminophila]